MLGIFIPASWASPERPTRLPSVAKAYRVFLQPRFESSAPDTYLMDHSTIMYLMDPQGKFLKHFSYTTDAAALAKALAEAISALIYCYNSIIDVAGILRSC